jgi:hypothetical protein
MKQQNAFSVATLRITTVLAMLWALPVGPVSAIPIQLTGGGISVEDLTHLGGDITTFIHLVGPGFELTTDPRYDMFQFAGNARDYLLPGSTVDFSGGVQVISGSPGTFNSLFYGGQEYDFTGTIWVSTPSAVVGSLVTLPFNLSGSGLATNHMDRSFEVEFFGAGTATAAYDQVPAPWSPDELAWKTRSFSYVIEPPPTPEPTSWMLLGSGLLGYAARRRSARRNG